MHSIRRVASCTTVLLLAIAWALAPRAPAIAQSAAARKVLAASSQQVPR